MVSSCSGFSILEVIPTKRISEKEFEFRMREIQKDNLSKERARKLKEEKQKGKVKHKLPSTSKLILLGMILLCVQIVAFCEYAMMTLCDTSALYVLIGIPAALAPIIWGYYSKAKAENTEGGIRYMTVMEELRQGEESTSANHEETASEGDVG